MCGPTAIAVSMGALSMFSKSMEIVNTNNAMEQSAENTIDSYNAQIEALSKRAEGISDQAALDKLERQRQAMREQARIRVAAGEAGVGGGQSTQLRLADALFQSGYDIGIIEHNKDANLDQVEYQMESARRSADNRLASYEATSYGPLESFMGIASSTAQGAASGYMMGSMFGGPTGGASLNKTIPGAGDSNGFVNAGAGYGR
jgi:hypothetical protein